MDEIGDPLTHTIRNEPIFHDLLSVISACQHGKIDIVEEGLKQGIPPDSTDSDNCSLLHWASINNRIEIVRLLLAHNADPNALGGVLVSTPLHWAARSGHVAICALLVKAGAVCNIRDVQGYTPIHLAIQGSRVPLVAYFLLKFDYAKDIPDNSGMTPAMWCAYRSFSMFPLRLIVKSHADLSIKELLMGSTALHIAAQERNVSAVIELLEGGASVAIRNKQQETPLDIARNNKNPKILDAMEEAARKQNLLPSSFFRTLCVPPISTYFLFFLPSLALILTYLIFSMMSFLIATIITLAACFTIMVLIQFDFHTPTYRLLPYGITIAEAALMIVSWSVYAHWFVPWWAQLLFVISFFMLIMSLIRIATVDPGVVVPPKNRHQMYIDEAESGIQYQDKYCFTCFVRKMEQTKHCAICDHCVARFDHHCPWLHRCITRRNMREFIVFILSVIFSSAIYCLATGHYALIEIREHGIERFLEDRAFLVITIFLSAMHAVMLSALFCVQINQISLDVTTNERIKSHRAAHRSHQTHDHLSSHSLTHQPISLASRCHNLLDFFSSNGDSNW